MRGPHTRDAVPSELVPRCVNTTLETRGRVSSRHDRYVNTTHGTTRRVAEFADRGSVRQTLERLPTPYLGRHRLGTWWAFGTRQGRGPAGALPV